MINRPIKIVSNNTLSVEEKGTGGAAALPLICLEYNLNCNPYSRHEIKYKTTGEMICAVKIHSFDTMLQNK